MRENVLSFRAILTFMKVGWRASSPEKHLSTIHKARLMLKRHGNQPNSIINRLKCSRNQCDVQLQLLSDSLPPCSRSTSSSSGVDTPNGRNALWGMIAALQKCRSRRSPEVKGMSLTEGMLIETLKVKPTKLLHGSCKSRSENSLISICIAPNKSRCGSSQSLLQEKLTKVSTNVLKMLSPFSLIFLQLYLELMDSCL